MKLLSILFIGSLLLGQLGGISVYPGVVIYVHDILLAVLVSESFVQYLLIRTFIRPKLLKPIILFAGVAVLSLLTNSGRFQLPQLTAGSLYLVRWLFYACVYVLVLQSYVPLSIWLYGLYAAGTAMAIVGFIQFAFYPDLRNLTYLGWDPHYYRLFGTLFDPNFTGILLVLTFMLGIYLWQHRRYKLLLGIGQAASMLALLLTYSRSSYLALTAGLGVFLVMKRRLSILAGIALFIGAVFLFPKIPGSTLDLFREQSSVARVGNWQEGVRLIAQAPVLGHGFNTLRYLTADNGPVVSKAAAGLDSSFLFVGATVGIAGMLAYAFLWIAMVRIGRGSVYYLAVLAALFVHSLFVNSAFYPWVMIWVWILTGTVERQVSGDR